METRETVRLRKNHAPEKVREMVIEENIYQQKDRRRITFRGNDSRLRIRALGRDPDAAFPARKSASAVLTACFSACAS